MENVTRKMAKEDLYNLHFPSSISCKQHVYYFLFSVFHKWKKTPVCCVVLLLITNLNILAQNEFDKYGPFGCQVYTDLKEVLKTDKKVYKIDLSYQKIDMALYEKMDKLTDLQALKLSSNGVTDYPKNFQALFNLTYFASYNNALTQFPPDLKPFSNLHYLELQNTKIDSIPVRIAYLNKLQSLKFGNTDDTLKLPATFHYLTNLKDVSFENCVLDSFPKPLFKLPALTYLYLSNTNTYALSVHFERLQKLEVLIVENNKLTEIPFEIYKARKLRFISLRNNKLTKLPDSISQLENLSLLDVSGNNFAPEELEKLRILLPGCEIRS
jgi:Leucine-rich repeat (LRR) protein